jgi:hypothetical protein
VTEPDGRIPVGPQPGDEHDWSYLRPVVDAERSWGNEPLGDFTPVGRGEGWSLHFRDPLHVARLRETFRFPDFVSLVDDEPRTEVVDTRFPYQEIRIHGGRPPGWVPGDSSSGYVRDDSRLGRLVRRLLGVRDSRA